MCVCFVFSSRFTQKNDRMFASLLHAAAAAPKNKASSRGHRASVSTNSADGLRMAERAIIAYGVCFTLHTYIFYAFTCARCDVRARREFVVLGLNLYMGRKWHASINRRHPRERLTFFGVSAA